MRWDVINWPLYIFLLPSEIGAMRKTGQVVEKEATRRFKRRRLVEAGGVFPPNLEWKYILHNS